MASPGDQTQLPGLLLRHYNKTKREQEAHEVKMDIARGVKDFVEKGVKALGHMED